jgi:hypothetical protein
MPTAKRSPEPPSKSDLHRELGASRKSQAPRKGARVEYPVPLPPIAHVKYDAKGKEVPQFVQGEDGDLVPNKAAAKLPLHEIAVPTGDEQWFPAKVIAIEHYERTLEPDGYVASIQPLNAKGKPAGAPLSISVVFVREA